MCNACGPTCCCGDACLLVAQLPATAMYMGMMQDTAHTFQHNDELACLLHRTWWFGAWMYANKVQCSRHNAVACVSNTNLIHQLNLIWTNCC